MRMKKNNALKILVVVLAILLSNVATVFIMKGIYSSQIADLEEEIEEYEEDEDDGASSANIETKIATANENASTVYGEAQVMMQNAIINEYPWVPNSATIVSGKGGMSPTDNPQTISDALSMQLGESFSGFWLVEFDENCNVMYALWSSMFAPPAGQRSMSQNENDKGQIGCYPIED